MAVVMNFLFAFISTLGWSVHLNAPKKDLVYCSITGATGWITYFVLNKYTDNPIFSNFIASFFITLLSEFFARKLKRPATLYIIPGIITLVPGLSIYNTMLNLIQGEYIVALEIATRVGMISGAIVMGMLIVTSVMRGFTKIKYLKTRYKKRDNN